MCSSIGIESSNHLRNSNRDSSLQTAQRGIEPEIRVTRQTLQEISEQLTITRERVRQRESKALDALRVIMIQEYGEEMLSSSARTARDNSYPTEGDEE